MQLNKYYILAIALTLLLTIVGITSTAITKGQHVVLPRENYFLEYDPAVTKLNIWDYTPQPDFNAAYSYIEKHKSNDDVFIVAHTALHHWYLPGSNTYWLGFLFLNDPKRTSFLYEDEDEERAEGYMGYPIITSRDDLEWIFTNHHGFVIIDYYAMSTKTPSGYVKYLLEKAPVVFHNDAAPDKPWTRIWVGKF